jgi:hypothetical protein
MNDEAPSDFRARMAAWWEHEADECESIGGLDHLVEQCRQNAAEMRYGGTVDWEGLEP